MVVFWFLIISYVLLSISLYKVFEKCGEPGWKGLVPGLNFMVWCKLVGRKSIHAIWLLIPIVNIFIFVGMAVDMVRSFGKYRFWHSAIAVIYAPAIFFYLGYTKEEKYLGPTLEAEKGYKASLEEARAKNDTRTLRKLQANNPFKKSQTREWVEAIIFAVFAAAFIRMFLIEAYTIPTPSMEDSLLVGDFLFVSKAHYGIRTPKTIAMVPLLHNRVPFFNTESYFSWPSLEMKRLPALESIDRNDPVVFNYPEGDSVYVFPERTFSIYDYRRGNITPARARQIQTGSADLVVRPIDKMDHYIKRCIGIAGDTVEIRNRQVYINGQEAENPKKLEFTYKVNFESPINTNNFSEWGISSHDIQGSGPNYLIITLTDEQKQKIEALGSGIQVEHLDIGSNPGYAGKLFPHDSNFASWTIDNYGPIWVPKKGETVQLTPENIALYERIIQVYENNDYRREGGKFLINGQEASEYTFKQDYFWMMGDNRHNSEDSRFWGFVPRDHVVGKPLFIWFSLKEGSLANGINWNRLFTSANKMD